MKIAVPVIVKDPEVSDWKEIAPTEEVVIDEEMFLDGPVSPRVAILDFGGPGGALQPGVRVLAPSSESEVGRCLVDRLVMPGDTEVSAGAGAVSTFGAVHKTMAMFEEPDALGRRVRWAFDAPHLLVVPRAGQWANAYYERETHSLQFFHFEADGGRTVHTCHSQDIVAHEAAHAVLDGVAPRLYSAVSPQSLAIHESVADLAALLASFRCRELARRVLESEGGSIARSTAFSGLAEQFATALDRGRPYLRDLNNRLSLKEGGRAAPAVDSSEPHALSEVLSGAFYSVLVRVHEELWKQYQVKDEADQDLVAAPEAAFVDSHVGAHRGRGSRDRLAAAAKALFVASERLKRTVFRGLDYLPPGDATFADLGRAILASDEASHPESSRQRTWLEEEFVGRGLVDSRADLDVVTNYEHPGLRGLDLAALVDSDLVAYKFAARNRELLRIPRGASYEVHPRLDVTKLYWHRTGEERVRECLFKVSWTEIEPNAVGRGLPARRRWTAGTTLAIEWADPPRVRAVLSTTRSRREREATDGLIGALVASDSLRLGEAALGPSGQLLRGVIAADDPGGVMRIRGMGRMLHVTRER